MLYKNFGSIFNKCTFFFGINYDLNKVKHRLARVNYLYKKMYTQNWKQIWLGVVVILEQIFCKFSVSCNSLHSSFFLRVYCCLIHLSQVSFSKLMTLVLRLTNFTVNNLHIKGLFWAVENYTPLEDTDLSSVAIENYTLWEPKNQTQTKKFNPAVSPSIVFQFFL